MENLGQNLTQFGQKPPKIIWAFDPFEKNRKIYHSGALVLQALAQKVPISVEPVYTFGAGYLDPSIVVPETFIGELFEVGQRSVSEVTKKFKIPDILPIRILHQPATNSKEQAEGLIRYSKAIQADLIVASTHARSGLSRLMLGSFAEALCNLSDTPILLVNPLWKKKITFKKILFPTDFSENSRSAYLQLLKWARLFNSKIKIFHRFQYEMTPELQTLMKKYPIYSNAYKIELDEKQRQGTAWVQLAQESDVAATFMISRQSKNGKRVDEEINDHSKKNIDLIAMVSQSGPWPSRLLGSIARKVVRSANCPVWVVHK